MANNYFLFKEFTILQEKAAMKVTTDACLFGAWAANKLAEKDQTDLQILDIGTGTGLLSLMLIQKTTSALIDAIEIDRNAYEQAIENVMDSRWKEKIQVFHADIKSFESEKKYDIIISNPPFYENELKAVNLKKNLAHHNDGLLLSEIVELIKKFLAPGGQFYLLFPYKRYEELKKLLTVHYFQLDDLSLVKQTVSHDYFRIMLCGSLPPSIPFETACNEISIKDKDDNYTPAFIKLLKDYYLYL
jgi:tRNA1Val (adenine37-N6)-methyltransferase